MENQKEKERKEAKEKEKEKEREAEKVVITFISRRDSKERWVERQILNEVDVVTAIQGVLKPEFSELILIDMATLPFPDQVRLISRTDVLIGYHGAGLTHIVFLPQGMFNLICFPSKNKMNTINRKEEKEKDT